MVVLTESGQHQHAHGVTVQPPGRLDPVHPRHPDVEHKHVRRVFPDCGNRLGTVRGLGNDLHVRLVVENHRESTPDQLLVIRDHDPDAHRTTSGIVART